MSAFLELGGVCPVGYAPGSREYLPFLPDATNIRFIVGRPQDAPGLAATGQIDAFLAFQDTLAEACAAGLQGVERVLVLPFDHVDIVVLARREAPFTTLGELLSSVATPIRCASELPFLARKTFHEEEAYTERFGTVPPAIELHSLPFVEGNDQVRISWSAGSCEPHVAVALREAALVVRSTGETIRHCRLKVIKHVMRCRPALFCRAGLRDDPVLAAHLDWFVERLEVGSRRWHELGRWEQRELPFPSVGGSQLNARASAQALGRAVETRREPPAPTPERLTESCSDQTRLP